MLDSAPVAGVPENINGRYEVKDAPIGQGGMGIVYKAYDTVTKRYVALKTMWDHVDPAALELFEREWTVLARLSHPNIVDILDTGELRENGRRKPYFVMPLLPGITLDRLIQSSSQRLTVERTVEIVCQACRGLQAAHDQGLVHRDIKPSNIFVMDDDTVKIIDFGVVHLADMRSVTGLKGTLHYMAPEQLDNKPATALSDIFSLGVVCYETLTGRRPFAGKTEAEIFDSIRTHIPPPAGEINAAVNELLSRTVHKALAKQPWHRFSSAREFSDTLRKAIRNEPIERFDRAKILPRLERIKKAQAEGDYQFAAEILNELESEGHIDPEMPALRIQIDEAIRQKTIRQLLDSARTRMEEDEYPLALQKVQDVLNLDPHNFDASSLKAQIERQRSEKQVENWFRLVAQHLDNEDYAQARQGLEQVLKINQTDTRARELLAKVDRTEREAIKAREENRKLYESALASYRNGEISTALSKLERLLEMSRSGPKSAAAREAQYQSLYNQIRSERDAARNAYAEGRKHLEDRNFARTLEICKEHLQKHPGDPLFQALKLEAEEIQRQEQSAAVAEISRRVEAEADLDKKYSILSEAVERYPGEPQFKSSLKLVRDRRDLINSIVGRARQYEERGQINDAAGQWDILKNIYPLYPGLDFEIQRLTRRREEQAKDEAKARWVEKIDRYLGAAEYAKAIETVRQALCEFPEDRELQGLGSLATQGIKRSEEAAALLEQGQALLAGKMYDQGLSALRNAGRLDEHSPAVRSVLLSALLQHARELMTQDWRSAEPLVKEALELDAADPIARSLSSLIEDYRRQDAVDKIVLEARTLQASGDLPAALSKVEEGLLAYPNEIRLSQLHNTLRNAENRRREISLARVPESQPAPPAAEALARPDRPVEASAPIETIIQTRATPEPAQALAAAASAGVRTPAFPPPSGNSSQPSVAAPGPQPSSVKPPKKRAPLLVGAIAAALAIAAVLLVKLPRHTEKAAAPAAAVPTHTPAQPAAGTPNPAPVLPELRVDSDLPGAKLVLDDAPAADLQEGGIVKGDLQPGVHALKVLDGNRKEVFSFSFRVQPGELIALTANPDGASSGVIITSIGTSGRIYATPRIKAALEGQPLQPVPAAGLDLTLPSDTEARLVIDDGRTKPHAIPLAASASPVLNVVLSGAVERIPFTVTANIPDATVVVNGRPLKRSMVNGSQAFALPPGKYRIGVVRDDYEPVPEQTVELKAGDKDLPLLTFSLAKIVRAALLDIEAAPPGAEVVIDGKTAGNVKPDGAFSLSDIAPGNHSVILRKAEYEPLVQSLDFKAGAATNVNGGDMKPFGSLALKITPAGARITVRRGTDAPAVDRANNAAYKLMAGEYTVNAEAEKYVSMTQTVTIAPGKVTNIAWELKSIPTSQPVIPTPATIFEDGSAWKLGPSGWWIHDSKGYSFLRAQQGRVGFEILREPPKGFFRNKVKKVTFVAEYKGESDRVVYTLDAHHLTRKIYLHGKSGDELKFDTPGGSFSLVLEMTPSEVRIRTGSGQTLDTLKREGTPGRFGFQDEVTLFLR